MLDYATVGKKWKVKIMRLDKFLKISRLVKRRPVANELCDAGNVKIDQRTAKASAEVSVGQTLTLQFGNRTVVVEILDVPEKAVPAQSASKLYRILSETRSPQGPPL